MIRNEALERRFGWETST